jgi:anti-sigma28 factor (negative regulator of flagellin synthesis)
MQVLKGTKREITLMEWDEQLKKAEKKLADSKECYRRFGDDDSKQWAEEDEKKVAEIKQYIKEVTEFMDKNNIK